MTRTLYVDCVAGVAGDMLLGALLDAGAEAAGGRARARRAGRRGHGARRGAGDAPGHRRDPRRGWRGAAGQPHRDWASIRAQIDAAGLPERARLRAQEAFRRLAVAEGAVHGIDPERVHFHEVGAVDAIGEVCGVALALEELGIERVVCSPLPVGRGFVEAAHGRLPLPAPATLELLRGAPLVGRRAGGRARDADRRRARGRAGRGVRAAAGHDAGGRRLRRRHPRAARPPERRAGARGRSQRPRRRGPGGCR